MRAIDAELQDGPVLPPRGPGLPRGRPPGRARQADDDETEGNVNDMLAMYAQMLAIPMPTTATTTTAAAAPTAAGGRGAGGRSVGGGPRARATSLVARAAGLGTPTPPPAAAGSLSPLAPGVTVRRIGGTICTIVSPSAVLRGQPPSYPSSPSTRLSPRAPFDNGVPLDLVSSIDPVAATPTRKRKARAAPVVNGGTDSGGGGGAGADSPGTGIVIIDAAVGDVGVGERVSLGGLTLGELRRWQANAFGGTSSSIAPVPMPCCAPCWKLRKVPHSSLPPSFFLLCPSCSGAVSHRSVVRSDGSV